MQRRIMPGLAVACLALSGCLAGLRSDHLADDRHARLEATYPDLSEGRFRVIADFESLEHAELFQVVSASQLASCIPSLTGGVPETGSRCLRVTLADPRDTLVISNRNAGQWSLDADWRPYWLLIGAIHSPQDALALELTIRAGPEGSGHSVHSRLLLNSGWNILRLDLAEAAEHLPLDNIRALEFALPETAGPVELRVDDVLLADNRRDVFGSSEDPPGRLYIQQQGRRWNIGATGRFELGFANGQIVHWYDLGSDPHRQRNLVAGSVLGPTPVVVPPTDPEGFAPPASSEFSMLGPTVIARQHVLEASPVRVTVACTWRFTEHGVPDEAQRPFQSWLYTVLPDGKIHVHVECSSEQNSWRPDDLGLALTRADDGGVEGHAHRAAQLEDPEALRHACYGFLRPHSGDDPGVSLTVHDARTAPVVEVLPEPERRRISLVTSGGRLKRPVHAWNSLLRVWPPGHCDETAAQALDYCYPARLDVQVGQSVRDTPGDANADGYNERLGCYVLRPDGDLLRFRIDGSAHPRFSPVFSVLDSAGRNAWVYVDNVILENTHRDAADNAVFQIPRTIRRPAVVEVVLRGPPALQSS